MRQNAAQKEPPGGAARDGSAFALQKVGDPFAGVSVAVGIFLLIQAIILKFDSSILIPTTTTPLIYPYFFVNLDTQGVGGVLMWIGILSVAFVVVGFLFFGLDKLGKKKLDK